MSTTPWAPTTLYDYRGGDRISDLIMRRGQIQAERASRLGEIVSGGIQNAGQQIGSALQQHRQEQEKQTKATELATRDAAMTKFVESWDGKDPKALWTGLRKIGGPDGIKLAEGVFAAQRLSLESNKQDKESKIKDFDIALKTAAGLKYPQFERWWSGMRSMLAPTAEELLGVRDLPEESSPELYQDVQDLWAARSGAKPEEPIRGRPGDVFLDPTTLQPRASVPAEAKPDTRSPELQALDAKARGDMETYNRIIGVRKQMGQADDRPASPGLSPTMESNIVNRLTTQWDKAVAPAQDLSRQAKLMQTGLAAAERGDMAAGSQAVLVTFQKILDPTSVVRESEYARSASGQAMLARIQGSYDKLVKGGAGVPISELKKFARLAEEMVASSMGDYVGAVKERIGKTADRYKIPRELIFEDYSVGKPSTRTGPASVITQRNTDTGSYRHSVDGGKTWKPGKP